MLSDFVYKAATQIGVVRAYPTTDLESGGYTALSGGATRVEAERRR